MESKQLTFRKHLPSSAGWLEHRFEPWWLHLQYLCWGNYRFLSFECCFPYKYENDTNTIDLSQKEHTVNVSSWHCGQ